MSKSKKNNKNSQQNNTKDCENNTSIAQDKKTDAASGCHDDKARDKNESNC